MRKSLTIWSSAILFSVSGLALAGQQQEMPSPPVQSADPHKAIPPRDKGDYLEQQPDQNNAKPDRRADDKQQQDKKVRQPGKSHQKQPEGGGVDVK
ncbi:MAG TPA: hypothetical protein VN063_03165 [Methylophilaceae bacterium]|nr:hypothetical protein [Methylophilaceae bacterium]